MNFLGNYAPQATAPSKHFFLDTGSRAPGCAPFGSEFQPTFDLAPGKKCQLWTLVTTSRTSSLLPLLCHRVEYFLCRQIYSAMMEAAMEEPLNATEASPALHHIRELIGVRPNPRL